MDINVVSAVIIGEILDHDQMNSAALLAQVE